MVDQPYYPTSQELEDAADVLVGGIIVSIELDSGVDGGPTWVVGFDGESSSGISAYEAMGENIIRLPKVCGEAPYGDTFAVGSRYIMLLVGPTDGVFYPVNTTQGVIPIIDGTATPLASAVAAGGGEAVTITYTTAAGFGAPFPPVDDGVGFVAAEIEAGIPESVAPQFNLVDVGVAWSPEEGVLWVFTAGSSGCPVFAAATATGGGTEVRIVLSSQLAPGEGCNADLVMYTSRVAVPADVDPTVPLTVDFAPDGTMWSGEPETIVVKPRPAPGTTGPAAWAPPRGGSGMALDADNLSMDTVGWAPGFPSWFELPAGDQLPRAGAAWSQQPNLLLVFTWGSSSCPTIATEATRQGDTAVIVLQSQADGAICTEDWAPQTSLVMLPAELDNGDPLTVQIGDLGSVVVEPNGPVDEYGWHGEFGATAWLL